MLEFVSNFIEKVNRKICGWMMPPWVKYSSLSSASPAWRRGSAKKYLSIFEQWWITLSDDDVIRYLYWCPVPEGWENRFRYWEIKRLGDTEYVIEGKERYINCPICPKCGSVLRKVNEKGNPWTDAMDARGEKFREFCSKCGEFRDNDKLKRFESYFTE